MKRILNHLGTDWYKYLLELIVITTGILGAFALNNWNDHRKDLAEEQVILKGLKIEFEQNLEELSRDHKNNELSLNSAGELLQKNRQPTPAVVIDSLFGQALDYRTFDPRRGVVSELIASGKLGLIQDVELRYKLTQWSAELADMEEDNILRRSAYQLIISTYNKFVSHRNIDHIHTRPYNTQKLFISSIAESQKKYDNLMASSEFDGALFEYFGSQTWIYADEKALKEFMEKTLDLINRNLAI